MEIPKAPATTPEDADERYKKTVDCDPFPRIPPALLNSADIYDYIRATGMILPFNQKRLKAASYEVAIGSTYVYWDGKGEKCVLGANDKFTLYPNSIAFVETLEEFRLPYYIAVRFNLRINNVHRGLLLGTGPLVDPGFEGPLLVPLHNLTTNEYVFRPGDKFAWFEFTKISPDELWSPEHRTIKEEDGRCGKYVTFPREKKQRDIDKYFEEALSGVHSDAIRSSIPQSIVSAEDGAKRAAASAEAAKKAAKSARRRLVNFGGIAIAAVVLTLGGVVLASWQLVGQIQESVSANRAALAGLSAEFDRFLQLARQVEALTSEVSRTSGSVEEAGADVTSLQGQLQQLRNELVEVRATLSTEELPEEPPERQR